MAIATASKIPIEISATKLLINNQWVDSISGHTFETINPARGEVICKVAAAEAEDVGQAVRTARMAFTKGEWATMSPSEHGK